MKTERYYIDSPTRIELDAQVDLNAAASTTIEARRPDGTVTSWTATVENSTVLVYDPAESQWDMLGDWTLQGKFLLPGKIDFNYTKSVSVKVRPLFT